MKTCQIVSQEEWLKARLELLEKEKANSRARDELTRDRMSMPWVKVEKPYSFQSAAGTESLSDLFGDKTQLIVHHFMFDPDWEEGCKSCSFSADHYDRSAIHIAHRDVALVAVSIAPWQKLDAYRQRMGWTFKWVSSAGTVFNRDFHVSFTDEEISNNQVCYNYKSGRSFVAREAPGFSVFAKDDADQVFHTYSCYGRGLENTIGAYNYLDLVPKGRDEDGLAYGMEWLRHRDRYDDDSFIDPYADKV
ncbi:MAG: DUF899 domain-containing protein [Hyphomicrobiaceae bacterium]